MPDHALAARFERDDVLARGEHHLAERHHAFLADRLADHGKGLLADFAVRHDVIRIAHIKLVDLAARHEFFDFDDVLAFDGDGFDLFRLKLDIFALVDLVAFDDFSVVDFVAGFGVDFLVADAVAGLFVDLVEADLFPLRSRREERNRT